MGNEVITKNREKAKTVWRESVFFFYERERQTDRQAERETDKERQRERDTERERERELGSIAVDENRFISSQAERLTPKCASTFRCRRLLFPPGEEKVAAPYSRTKLRARAALSASAYPY